MSRIKAIPRDGKYVLVILPALALFVWFGPRPTTAAGMNEESRQVEVDAYFSPDGDCEARILSEIREARRDIRVQMYLFSSQRIATALVDAAERGVDVRVVLDASEKKKRWSKWRVLKEGGVKVRFDDAHTTANCKVLLIDDHTVVTGSYNYTKAAESKNAENIVIIRHDDALFSKFLRNFESHAKHAR